MKNLEWEAEVLAQRFAAVQEERDSLYEKFEASVYDVAQKTGEWWWWWGPCTAMQLIRHISDSDRLLNGTNISF